MWSPANTGPLAVSNQVLTLHDLSPFEHPEWYRHDFAGWYRLFLPVLVRKVRRVATSSEYTRRKVIARFGLPADRVVVIHGGVDRSRFKPQKDHSGQGNYILFVGSLEPRKNLAVLLRAWKVIEGSHPDLSLVIVGATERIFRPFDLATEMERVQFAGYTAETDLPGLYAGAAAFVLPSFDEGFGLPVLEAMACGVPVVASNRGALPEVVGDAGLLFDPRNHMALAALLESCLTDVDLRQDLRYKGLERSQRFSWSAAAERMWALLQEAYAD